jgi:hypothetical protein
MTENTAINAGAFTIMFDITGLTSAPTQTNTGLAGQLFVGGQFPGSPTWTTADNWPVVGAWLDNPSSIASGSLLQFPDSYVVDGTWVSGSPIASLPLQIGLSGQPLDIVIHQAVITMEHTSATHMANGTISGVIITSELVQALMEVAGHLSTSLCSGAAFQSIATQIEQDSDILQDGTNVAGVPCDAISVGLGFTADQIGLPMVVAAPVTPPPNPCADGG